MPQKPREKRLEDFLEESLNPAKRITSYAARKSLKYGAKRLSSRAGIVGTWKGKVIKTLSE